MAPQSKQPHPRGGREGPVPLQAHDLWGPRALPGPDSASRKPGLGPRGLLGGPGLPGRVRRAGADAPCFLALGMRARRRGPTCSLCPKPLGPPSSPPWDTSPSESRPAPPRGRDIARNPRCSAGRGGPEARALAFGDVRKLTAERFFSVGGKRATAPPSTASSQTDLCARAYTTGQNCTRSTQQPQGRSMGAGRPRPLPLLSVHCVFLRHAAFFSISRKSLCFSEC